MVEQVTAGIYTRLSLDRTGDGLAVQRQEAVCRDLATRQGWTVAEVYEDNDVSASSGKECPEYQRLLADLESGTINAVVVYAWDRLARRMTDLVAFIDAERTKIREAAQAKARAVPLNNYASQKYLDFGRMNLSQKRTFISSHITDVIVGPAVSRGHQAFDPARFECHYPDGTSERLERPVDGAHAQSVVHERVGLYAEPLAERCH